MLSATLGRLAAARILDGPPCLALAAVLCGACQAPAEAPPEDMGDDCEIDGDLRFLPIVEGASWTLDTVGLLSGSTERKTQVVGALADVGGPKAGTMAFPVTTTKSTGEIVVWQEDTGSAVVRHMQVDRAGMTEKDDVYTPHKGRLDEAPEHLMEGATWSESYVMESTDIMTGMVTMEDRVEDWELVRYGELVEVPAGEFCTIQVRRIRTTDGNRRAEKFYWFARGVGKVRERTGNTREELIEFDIPGT